MSNSIDSTLKERGERYGKYEHVSDISQALKLVKRYYLDKLNKDLDPPHEESLDLIFNKIGRIISGDPNYIDNFRDIAGYAELVVKHLESLDGATDTVCINRIRDNGIWKEVEKACTTKESSITIRPSIMEDMAQQDT